MTNLYTAEYEGNTFIFEDVHPWADSLRAIGGPVWFPRKRLTNITPVKVVPADAIVLDEQQEKDLRDLLDSIMEKDKSISVIPRYLYNRAIAELLNVKLFPIKIELPTPMAEPQGFGAIVEANMVFGNTFGSRFRFVRVARDKWIVQGNAESIYSWSDLVSNNPTLISKGVE